MPEKVKEVPKKPNFLGIWGDDVGISNPSCYTLGLMGNKTPNVDRLAKRGHDLHRFLPQKMLPVHLGVQGGVPLIPIVILGTPTTELVNAILKIVVYCRAY
jgi:hypothetical protein